jgi:hypothetical protein
MKKVTLSTMRFNNNLEQKSRKETQCYRVFSGGFRVRANVHIGAWWCNSCVGKTEGSQLIQPNCDYCQIS